MLKSRTIADALIDRFGLKELYEKETMVRTRNALANYTSISAGNDGLIVIEVDDEDPQRAADMANAYVEELEEFTSTLAVTEAAQRRLFFERQLAHTKEDLARAEIALKEIQEETGLVQLDQQGRAMIEAVASLRANIGAKEVQLASMRTFATEDNPEFRRVTQELEGLRSELRKLERGTGRDASDFLVAPGRIPAAGLEFVRKYRDLKYQETMFELIAKQYELARIDEARDAAVLQFVDKAVKLDFKSKPRRGLMVILAAIIAGMLGVMTAFVLEARERARSNPAQQRLFEELSKHLSRRRRS
jgi:capsule polysaccharide export protein KpsE/RkpR